MYGFNARRPQIFTRDDIVGMMLDDVDLTETMATIDRWITRGDGCAVYENVDLGHPEIGHRQFVSFGSTDAQLESEEAPERLPDIGTALNWRYRLVGVYR